MWQHRSGIVSPHQCWGHHHLNHTNHLAFLKYNYISIFHYQLFFCFLINHYAPVSQANWCNMTFTAGNLFPSHSCIGWPKSSPHWDLNPGPQIEKRTTYQLSYRSPFFIINIVRFCISLFHYTNNFYYYHYLYSQTYSHSQRSSSAIMTADCFKCIYDMKHNNVEHKLLFSSL